MLKYLSRIRPSVFLSLYLVFIPAFAVVFCILPEQHFYAPYAHLEPPAHADAAAVEKSITTSMIESYRNHENSTEGWRVSWTDLSVDNLATDTSDELSFTVNYFAIKQENGKPTASAGGPQFVARLSRKKIVTEKRPGWLVCHLVRLPPEADTVDVPTFNNHLLFRPSNLAIGADSVCWGGNEEKAFSDLLAGWSGDPRGLSGFFGRMVYFSATTITTVGFGDIIPITGVARTLTAIEAIAGWVLAGLFLNSMATQIAKGRP